MWIEAGIQSPEVIEQKLKGIRRYRRRTGLLLGLFLALTLAFITQGVIRLQLLDVPFFQPPFGIWGNTLIILSMGALIGLLAAWPDEPLNGVLLSAAFGTILLLIFNFFTARNDPNQADISILAKVVAFFVTFLPIAGLLALLIFILRWVINRLVLAHEDRVPFWRVAWAPLALFLVVGAFAWAMRLPDRAAVDLSQMQALIQAGLSAIDRPGLPESLKDRRVGDFKGEATADYTLQWDKQNLGRYGLVGPPGVQASEEAVVVANFENGWTIACLFFDASADPRCRSFGDESGEAFFFNSAPSPFDVAWDDYAFFEQGLTPGEATITEPLTGATIYHVDVTLPLTGSTLTGNLQARYTNRGTEPLDEIYFRLYPNQSGGKTQISNVTVDGQPVQTALENDGFALRVTLPSSLGSGESRIVAMDFEVQVPESMGGGNYGLLSHTDDIWALDAFLPTIAVYNEDGWQITPTPPNGDNTFHDAAYYLVQVRAPLDHKLVSSGSLIGGQTDSQMQKVLFAAGPARDFYLAASPNFQVSSRTFGATTVNSYNLPQVSSATDRTASIATDALRVFNQRFGSYPYTELDIVSLPFQARGIEYPGLIGLNTQIYSEASNTAGEYSPQDRFRATVAHEVAHQWFYNLVGSDQSGEPWLDEALAQYATWQYIVDMYTDGRTSAGLVNYWKGCVEQTKAQNTPVGLGAGEYADSKQYVGAVYCRGPLFIAALRERLGVENFDAFMKEYVTENRWRIATGADFRRLAEKQCQCDLDELWNLWGINANFISISY